MNDQNKEPKEGFEQLETNIEAFIENCRQVGIMVSDFQPGAQGALNTKLNDMISQMQEIDKVKSQVSDVYVPPEIFQYIDEGRNPQLYTRDCLQKVREKKDEVTSKVDAYKNFKSILDEELKKQLPQTMDKHGKFKRQQHRWCNSIVFI